MSLLGHGCMNKSESKKVIAVLAILALLSVVAVIVA